MAMDPFATVRKQAQRALAAVVGEIRRREAELQKLVEQAEQWRSAIGGAASSAISSAPAGAGKGKKAAKKKPRRTSPPVDWDAVFARLPKSFTMDDVAKRTPKLAKHPKSRIIAVARWARSKQIKKVGDGKYRKLG